MLNHWKKVLMFLVPAAALGLLLAMPLASAKGGKPKPPEPPPPPGRIVFQLGAMSSCDVDTTQNWEMNADGSGKQYVAPGLGVDGPSYAVGGTPSARNYEAARGRWFLQQPRCSDPQRELFAYGYINGKWSRLQVTDFTRFGFSVPYADQHVGRHPVWSNDGQDSFISLIVGEFEWVDGLAQHKADHIVRLWISGEELAGYAGAGRDPLIAPDDEQFEIVLTAPEEWGGYVFHSHHWDPTGRYLLYVRSYRPDVYLYDTLTRVNTVIGQVPLSTGASQWGNCRWSPTGGKIALNAYGKVWTVNPDGTGLITLLDNSNYGYWGPFFSPDGNWLVYRGQTWWPRQAQFESWIARIPVGGGKEFRLTSDMDKWVQKYAEGWFAE